MVEKKRCDVCNINISSSNWSKHIKSRKHKDSQRLPNLVPHRQEQLNHCWICNVNVPTEEWYNHTKSSSHKKNTKTLLSKIKEKIHKKANKRDFRIVGFETNDYLVRKSEEALEGCFLTLRVEPKHEIFDVDILMDGLPKLLHKTIKRILKNKRGIKLQLYLLGNFKHAISHEIEN
jgi:hypothetical protein